MCLIPCSAAAAAAAAGMSYGDGTITNADVIRETGISDPSRLFQHMPASSMGKLVLSPHVYPGTLTGPGGGGELRACTLVGF
jgi:hypothetical protein